MISVAYRNVRVGAASTSGTRSRCAARAAGATDALTRARFEQEAEEWLARAREAEEAQRRPSRFISFLRRRALFSPRSARTGAVMGADSPDRPPGLRHGA
jgi:hypothetical protein